MSASFTFKRQDDLVRLLNLIPYFTRHPGRSLMAAAKDLGMSVTELKQDLERLRCCGPGTYPDELVDLIPDLKEVKIIDAQGMDAPLRLTHTEAAALLLALEGLENVSGLVDRSAVVSAANKLREATGLDTKAVYDSEGESDEEEKLRIIRESMYARKQLTFSYRKPTGYTVNQRTVSATRLFTHSSESYLSAWDHHAQAHRTFKLDRISDVAMTQDPATPKVNQLEFTADDPFGFKKVKKQSTVLVAKEALWITDALPASYGEERDGLVEVFLPMVDEEWLIQFALSNADRVTVVSPPEVATQVSLRAESGLSLYDLPLNN